MQTLKSQKARSILGFTLVELLTVIAIIGILVAITVPAVTSAIKRGKQTKCMANVRNLGVAFLAFVVDNNNQGPYDGRDIGNYSISMWTEGPKEEFFFLLPYLNLTQTDKATPTVLICPEMSPTYLAIVQNPSNRTGSYGLNPDVTSNSGHTQKLMSIPQSRVAIADAWNFPFYGGPPNPALDSHQGRGLSVFRLNGSVEWIQSSKYAGCSVYDWTYFDNL